MLTVVAEICVKPGRREAVLAAIQALTPTVLQEQGCSKYQALVDHQAQVPWKQNLPDSIFILEYWDSLRHLEQHQQQRRGEQYAIFTGEEALALDFIRHPQMAADPTHQRLIADPGIIFFRQRHFHPGKQQERAEHVQ